MIIFLKSLLYTFILLGILILGLFTAKAFDYYIIKTYTQENNRQNERELFLFCLENQSSLTKFQAAQIQQLIKEKQEIIDRALDLQVANLELRKAVKRSVLIIDRLIGQVEAYKQHISPSPYVPKKNRTA